MQLLVVTVKLNFKFLIQCGFSFACKIGPALAGPVPTALVYAHLHTHRMMTHIHIISTDVLYSDCFQAESFV